MTGGQKKNIYVSLKLKRASVLHPHLRKRFVCVCLCVCGVRGQARSKRQKVIMFMDMNRMDTPHSRVTTCLQNTIVLRVPQTPPTAVLPGVSLHPQRRRAASALPRSSFPNVAMSMKLANTHTFPFALFISSHCRTWRDPVRRV